MTSVNDQNIVFWSDLKKDIIYLLHERLKKISLKLNKILFPPPPLEFSMVLTIYKLYYSYQIWIIHDPVPISKKKRDNSKMHIQCGT